MLAGEIMNVGGLSKRIVDFALALVGHIKGGLGYVTIVAAILLSALSGSAVADAAALTALLLPMMVKAGHDKARSGGLIAACGVIGPVIPPSIGFVIFGVAANVSISKLFLAGIFPGILIGAALWITWMILVRKEVIVPPPRKSKAEVFTAMRQAGWALMLPLIILFGLRSRHLHADRGGRGRGGVRLLRRCGDLPRTELSANWWPCSQPRPRPPRSSCS
jgi:tripartite ATP-independent transporter DctM subunit